MGRLHMGSMGLPSFIFSVVILSACAVALAQAPDYNVGRTPSQDEIRAWDISVPPDGKGLPIGSGTAIEGAKLYVQKGCVVCHGQNGRGGLAPHLVGTKDTPTGSGSSEKVMATLAPFATVLWDFLYRAMPLQRAGTLKPDEVYALTAYLLYRNDIIQENEVIDAQTLLKVKMPNRDAFVPPDISAYKPGTPKSYLLNPDPATQNK